MPPESGFLDRESYFVDIAGGDFGNIRITCWLQSENVTPGRRWGKLGSSHAAILPFSTTAQLLARNVRLKTFEIEMFLSEAGLQGSGPESFPVRCPGPECQAHSELCLIQPPAPSEVIRRYTGSASSNARTFKPWNFRSESIRDCDRHSRAAKWTWEAHNHEPVPLHGAIALRHQDSPFLVACRTRGELYVLLRRRARLRLDFNNESKPPEWWQLSPEPSHADLSGSLSRLDIETQRLNQNRLSSASAPSSREQAGTQGSNYGHVNIAGYANVIVGSGSFERRDRERRSSPRTQGRDLQDAPSHQTEQTEEITRLVN